MTDKRKIELFDDVVGCLIEHLCKSDIKLCLMDVCGLTRKEYNELGISNCDELTENEKKLIDFFIDDKKTWEENSELGFDYFMDKCNDFDVKPRKELIDELEYNGIYIEWVNARHKLGW